MQLSSSNEMFQGYATWGCRFLYVSGIQSVRIFKRVRRRSIRFFTPVFHLAVILYARTAGRQIEKLKERIRVFRENFHRDGEHLKELTDQLTVPGARGRIQQAGLHFVIRKKLVCSVLNIAAPVLATFVLLGTVNYWRNMDYGLTLTYGGREIAAIQDETVFEKATEMVNQRMVYDTAATANIKISPVFVLSAMDRTRYFAPSTLCDRIIQQSDGIIEEGSGLYVDGKLIGAVKSSADLTYILQNILNTARGSDLNTKVSFAQDVQTINGLFPTASIISAEEMNRKLTGTTQQAAAYTVQDGDTATAIAARYNLSLSELNRLNQNQVGDSLQIGMQVKVQTPETLLSVKAVRKETYQTALPYKTVTQKDDSQYTDYTKVVTEGKDGVQQCTDEVTYVDGAEVSRKTLSKKVVTQAVDKKIVTGTKKRPKYSGAGESSGSLMWPVPSIHTITSYFAWRWGTMHTGIDISGGNSYGKTIVAADGGVVSYVRYSPSGYGNHLQINHGDGTATLYAHTSKILVSSGQRVSKGQPIALIGSTGDSTGAHLHFEVIKNGQKVNPLNYVSR